VQQCLSDCCRPIFNINKIICNCWPAETPTENGNSTPTTTVASAVTTAPTTTAKKRPVAATANKQDTLPETGDESSGLLIMATALIAAGAVLTLRRRLMH